MTLKEKIEKAKEVERIRKEYDHYMLAITGNSKFSGYYEGKIKELKAELDAI